MKIKNISKTPLNGPALIEYERFNDERGSFSEIWSDELNDVTGVTQFYQMNEATCVPNSIRGLHLQYNPYMGKLIRSLEGIVYDYIVDIRAGSPTYGFAMIVALLQDVNSWFWVPPGFAHAIFSINHSRIQYFCSGKYNKDCEISIYPFSNTIDYSLCRPDHIKILKKIKKNPVISEKDRSAINLVDLKNDMRSTNFIYGKC